MHFWRFRRRNGARLLPYTSGQVRRKADTDRSLERLPSGLIQDSSSQFATTWHHPRRSRSISTPSRHRLSPSNVETRRKPRTLLTKASADAASSMLRSTAASSTTPCLIRPARPIPSRPSRPKTGVTQRSPHNKTKFEALASTASVVPTENHIIEPARPGLPCPP